jgi:hypothetical protein
MSDPIGQTRRLFLRTVAGFSCALAWPQEQPPTPIGSRHRPWPDKPEPGSAGPTSSVPAPGGRSSDRRAALAQQEQELRQVLEELFGKVQELRSELSGLHTADVFSVTVFKQTQQIEKLAKNLKNHAKIS